MTYTSVGKILADRDPEEVCPIPKPDLSLRADGEIWLLILNEKRRSRGSIDFDLPEPIIAFDEDGSHGGDPQVRTKHCAPNH